MFVNFFFKDLRMKFTEIKTKKKKVAEKSKNDFILLEN